MQDNFDLNEYLKNNPLLKKNEDNHLDESQQKINNLNKDLDDMIDLGKQLLKTYGREI